MAATRLLFGGGQDPEQVKQDIKATAWPIPMERYLAARPAGREAWEDPNLEDEARAFLMSHPEVRKDLLLDQASDRDTPSHKRKL